MLREFRFPRDAVKAWMGHAGVGVDNAGDILEQNYTGAVPDERIGVMSNALIQQDAKNGGYQTVNQLFVSRNLDVPRMADSSVVFAVPERVTNLTTIGEASNVTTEASEAQRKLIDETAEKQAVVVRGEREVLERQQEEARIARANQPLPEVDETIVRANARRNQQARDIAADERRIMALEKAEADNPLPKAEMSPALQAKMVELGLMDEPPKPKPKKKSKVKKGAAAKAAGKVLGPAGVVLTTAIAKQTKADVTTKLKEMDIPDPLAEVGGFVAGASEFGVVSATDMSDLNPDMMSMRPVERSAAENTEVRTTLEDLGMINEPTRSGDKKAAPPPDSFFNNVTLI